MDDNHYGRRELLYDKTLLADLADQFGNAIDIKEAVETPAFIYEIRTALEYWFGGQNNHRTNDGVWMRCKAVDDGMYRLVGDELKYAEDGNV